MGIVKDIKLYCAKHNIDYTNKFLQYAYVLNRMKKPFELTNKDLVISTYSGNLEIRTKNEVDTNRRTWETSKDSL